ncbi:hypothetical protein AI2828V5_3845 [Klebsiella oxytoca]|nr:hypothetical protein KOCBH_04621 [Klebsiella michiganensis]CAF2404282.1 hypothetical protein AI2828V5_3845 [Klebsiella oxytoca]CAH5830422.1 hypothetical protein AI2828V5_3845 [Klebsiella oxytoca]
MQFESEFNYVFQSSTVYRFTQPGLSLCLVHSMAFKSQCLSFGGKLLTHTTPTASGGVALANPFSGVEFSYCHKKALMSEGLI